MKQIEFNKLMKILLCLESLRDQAKDINQKQNQVDDQILFLNEVLVKTTESIVDLNDIMQPYNKGKQLY